MSWTDIESALDAVDATLLALWHLTGESYPGRPVTLTTLALAHGSVGCVPLLVSYRYVVPVGGTLEITELGYRAATREECSCGSGYDERDCDCETDS